MKVENSIEEVLLLLVLPVHDQSLVSLELEPPSRSCILQSQLRLVLM